MENHQNLVNQLIEDGYLVTPHIIEAFRAIQRESFLPNDRQKESGMNIPIHIGYGQTISQPLTVAYLLEKLQPRTGDKVLDVGSGSGWQTALLAHIVGPKGKVTAIERIRPLLEFGKANCAKYSFATIEFVLGDGTQGYPKRAPYDKIAVAAAALEIPESLTNQLAIGGTMVIPVGAYHQDLVVVHRRGANDIGIERFPGFQFVPLIPGAWGSE